MNTDKKITFFLLILIGLIALFSFSFALVMPFTGFVLAKQKLIFLTLLGSNLLIVIALLSRKYRHKVSTPLSNNMKQADEQLTLLSRVFTDICEGIAITNNQGVIINVNKTFCKLTGYSAQDIIGQNPRILSSGKQSPEFYANMWKSVFKHGYWRGEVWNRKKNGELYAEQLTISALKNDKNETTHYIGLFSDITRKKEQQEKLNLMAHYDALTHLPNRSLFTDRFHQAIAHSKRTETQLAICFLDLDDFKPVNDNFGHDIGDQLLIEVGKRITEVVRKEDTVSRQGGDEFVILLGDLESYFQCEQSIKRIQRSLSLPFLIEGISHNISASIGIALYPSEQDDIDSLMRHADQAMYQAKLEGKHRYRLFDEKQHIQMNTRQLELDEIRAAISNNEFHLYYQPKVDMSSGTVFGFEALIRWHHPKKGIRLPENFLPLVEETDLEIELGYWIINEVLNQISLWAKQSIDLEISVNVSSYILQNTNFYQKLEESLSAFPSVNPKLLQMEILESRRSSDRKSISKVMKICSDNLGVSFAWDHFGTRSSSLTHLQNLPASTIKIDKNLIKNMMDDPNDLTFVEGIIGLAEAFNRKIIAKGVETAEQGLMLLIMGCKNIQGSAITLPISPEDIPNWLENYLPNRKWVDCNNKYKTTKERRIKLLKLANTHWRDRFEDNVKSSPKSIENWPIMDSRYNHCSHWLKRAKQECDFDQKWLDRFSMSYQKIYLIAHFLLLEYQNECFQPAREGLKALRNAFDEMELLLDETVRSK